MKLLILASITLALLLGGCKEDVHFNSTSGEPRNSGSTTQPPQLRGPGVRFVQTPQDHRVGDQTSAIYQIIPGDGEVIGVSCVVDNEPIDCGNNEGLINLNQFSFGLHVLEVSVKDDNELSASAKENWSVYDKFLRQNEELDVNLEKTQTDILFVIDNSVSMKYEQTKISQRFDHFVDQIDKIDWRIAITTTDARSARWWSDGQLSPFKNGDYYLNSSMSKKEAQKLFSQNVKRKENGSNTEEGIYNSFRSIERAFNPKSEADERLRNFFRDEAALAIVVVSDEDESGKQYRNQGSNLIKLVEDSWGADKVFQFNSIIVHTNECLRGEGYAMGFSYEALSKKTGGTVGDICAPNYSALLSHLGKGVADLQKTHKLKCVPQDIDKDGQVDLQVTSKDGQSIPGYSLDGDKVIFDQALEIGKYNFLYFCLTN